MNKPVFVDTSAWFAGIAKNDQYNRQALAEKHKLHQNNARFYTSNLVVHETTMFLERKINRREGISFLSYILTDPHVEVIHAAPEIEQEAYQTYRKYLDQDFSITDCVSFAIMKRFGISRAFTFDDHFRTMGFEVLPRREH